MKRVISLSVFIFLFTINLQAQDLPSVIDLVYPDEYGSFARQIQTGNYLVAGNTNVNGSFIPFLARLDSSRNVQWTLLDPGFINRLGRTQFAATADSNFFFVGWHQEGNGLLDLELQKWNEDGVVIWSKVYEKEGSQYGSTVVKINEEKYLIASGMEINDTHKVILLCVGEQGELLWELEFASHENPEYLSVVAGISIDPITNNIYLASNHVLSSMNRHTLLTKISENGEFLYSYKVGLEHFLLTGVAAIGNAGGAVICGDLGFSAFVQYINEDGQVVWEYANETDIRNIEDVVVADGLILVVGSLGTTNPQSPTFDDPWVGIFDMEGNIIQNHVEVLPEYDRIYGITPISDDRFLLVGSSDVDNDSQVYFSEFQIDIVNNVDQIEQTAFQLAPNPTSDRSYLYWFESNFKEAKLSLFSPSGQLIENQVITGIPHEINLSRMPNGIYFFRVEQPGNGPIVGKVIKQ